MSKNQETETKTIATAEQLERVLSHPTEPGHLNALRDLKSKVEADCAREVQAALDKYNCMIDSRPVLVPVGNGGHVIMTRHGVVMRP